MVTIICFTIGFDRDNRVDGEIVMTQSKMAGFTGFDGDNKVLEVSKLQALSPF